MKIKKSLFVRILLFIGAVSADDVEDVTAVSDNNGVQSIDNDLADVAIELQSADFNNLLKVFSVMIRFRII